MAKYKIFHYFLFKMLIKKNFLDVRFHKFITNYSRKHKDFFFIQIGANDGFKADPIYLYVRDFGWKGIVIEPVRYLFEKLKENYKNIPGIVCENIAIGEKKEFKDFYMLKNSESKNLPLWYDEIGSFIKENVTRYKDKIKEFDKYFISEKVKCLRISSLLNKYNIKKVDFLQIDTEGYDYEILKQIPFQKIKPSIIMFEDRHLSDLQKGACKRLLSDNGYEIVQLIDCFAYLKNT